MRIRNVFMVAVITFLAALPLSAQQRQLDKADVAEFGKPFPVSSFLNLNTEAGPKLMDLSAVLGKKPVILYYWIAGNKRAETTFQELVALVDELGRDNIALYGVAFQQPGREKELIVARMKKAGLDVPCLDDSGFKLGQMLRIQSVPNITLIDGEGILRATNGGSLNQQVEFNLDLRDAITRLGTGKSIGSYGYFDQYHPVNELVGKPFPDFKADLLAEKGSSSSLEDLIANDRLNVFVYWSVDCGHCRSYMPKLAEWVRSKKNINVVTAAVAPNDATRIKTREFCKLKQIEMPTLLDADNSIGELYQITTTPTILLIGPDGVVESVVKSAEEFEEIEEAQKRFAEKS